jgi:hypothetical protein
MRRIFWVGVLFLLATSAVFAQFAGTIAGRVVDQAGAVIANATATATNTGTGLSRTTATNSDGLYSFAALQPGVYNIKIEMTGFAPSVKNGVTLVGDSTLTVDFQLGVASMSQQVEVTEAAVMVETTQSVVAGSIQASEVQNLPMLNRTFMGLVTLTPEARPAPILNSTKLTFGGGISVGGGSGRSLVTEVDGAENRDDIVGGPMMNFSLEGVQEFKLLAHSFSAQYGRASAGVVEVVTKSGTNRLHGTAFAFGRNDAMTATEYFNAVGNLPKSAYNREQFGGSLGGPIKKDRWFIFGAVERTYQTYTQVFPTAVYNEAVIAKNGIPGVAGLPGLDAVPSQFVPQPFHDLLLTIKSDYKISDHHSLFVRYALQKQYAYDDQFVAVNSTNQPHPDTNPNDSYDVNHSTLYSLVGGETWLIGNNSVNTFTVQASHYNTTQLMPTTLPTSQWPLQNVTFPSIELGRTGPSTDQEFFEQRWEFKDDFSHQKGKHSLKFGGGFDFFPSIGMGILLSGTMGRINFFDNPSTIVNSAAQWIATPGTCTTATLPMNAVDPTHCGKYPEGFVTPGAVNSIAQGVGMACGCMWKPGGPGDARLLGMKDMDFYFQDDWKISPRFTLNLGARYDLAINSFNQSIIANNRAYKILHEITPIPGGYEPIATNPPRTPYNNVSPRVGFAWDLRGDGKTVIRAGGGLYWDKFLMEAGFQSYLISAPIIDTLETLVNTGAPSGSAPANIQGTGQLGNYVFGQGCVAPFPVGSGCTFTTPLPQNIGGNLTDLPTNIPGGANLSVTILSPLIQNPYNTQEHVGFTHAFTPNLTISSDYTHILGLHETRRRELNPVENAWDPTDQDKHLPWGKRRYSSALNAAFPGLPNLIGPVGMWETSNTLSKFDELATQIVYHGSRMTLQASYTLMYARAFGGVIAGNLGGTSAPTVAGNQDQPMVPQEWAPAATDERHRVVVSAVISLPWGFQASPIMQASSARPYTLTQGQDLNKDGANTDLYIDPVVPGNPALTCGCVTAINGTQVGVNSQRGAPIFDFDTRVTKTIRFSERMSLGLFAELYNLTNRANFGNYYVGKATATNFKQPFSYMLGYPTSRQIQLGARFSF